MSEAAGHTLQQQCSKIGPVAVGDIAVLNQTGNLNCQTVIFAACSSWNNGRGKQVLKVQSYKYKPTEKLCLEFLTQRSASQSDRRTMFIACSKHRSSINQNPRKCVTEFSATFPAFLQENLPREVVLTSIEIFPFRSNYSVAVQEID